MVSAPFSERSRSALSYRRPFAPPLSPSCLLRHDSGSYSSSTVTFHLFCEPRYELTSPHPSFCVFSIYSDLINLTFQGNLKNESPSTILMILYLDLTRCGFESILKKWLVTTFITPNP
ncbi:hypothetical protein F2Q70_00013123 [Brassica cretica]|uniref:Uncharacterized protein n=1 Tax=Brassica cretica TaxID=69181 RepID=A0A8S9M120_BRACR|nr:hypothetical protein F2Q70_00013123 [Brassica cretica]